MLERNPIRNVHRTNISHRVIQIRLNKEKLKTSAYRFEVNYISHSVRERVNYITVSPIKALEILRDIDFNWCPCWHQVIDVTVASHLYAVSVLVYHIKLSSKDTITNIVITNCNIVRNPTFFKHIIFLIILPLFQLL